MACVLPYNQQILPNDIREFLMAEPLSISVVVPVYNSEQSLPLLVERLYPILTQITPDFELILVNDGSRDNSWGVVETLITQHIWVTGINLMRNFGQHNALLCGIRAATKDIIVTIDDDLQNPPEEIPRLLEELNKGFDVVYGTPQKMQHGFFRNMASRVTKIALQGSMGVDIATKVSAYRVFRTQLREAFADYKGAYVSIDVLLTWATNKFSALEVRFDVRQFGASNYTLMKLIRHAMNMITGFSVVPLQIASILGFTFMIFGILVFIYVVVRFIIEGGSIPGFPFLASIVAIFSGVQLFALGIIGEYLARMHIRLMDKPSYVVRHSLHATQDLPKGIIE
jgi:undecaprenyl-phosphate 4-deoxy-4-formamido-L-arabinose transferase